MFGYLLEYVNKFIFNLISSYGLYPFLSYSEFIEPEICTLVVVVIWKLKM